MEGRPAVEGTQQHRGAGKTTRPSAQRTTAAPVTDRKHGTGQCHSLLGIWCNSLYIGQLGIFSMTNQCRMQWFRVRASNSRLREPSFKSSALKLWAILFTLHCSSSLSCMNEYLAKASGGYLPLRINCSVAG